MLCRAAAATWAARRRFNLLNSASRAASRTASPRGARTQGGRPATRSSSPLVAPPRQVQLSRAWSSGEGPSGRVLRRRGAGAARGVRRGGEERPAATGRSSRRRRGTRWRPARAARRCVAHVARRPRSTPTSTTGVAPRVLRAVRHRAAGGRGAGPAIVNQLAVERRREARPAPRASSGSTGDFANLRRADLLQSPWSGALPNAAYVDAPRRSSRANSSRTRPSTSRRGTVAVGLVYDTRARRSAAHGRGARRLDPRQPGRFTHDGGFTVVTASRR